MNYAHQYQTPPRWTPNDFMSAGAHSNYPPPPNYYSPRYSTATPSPRESPNPKAHGGHHRRASHAVPNAVPPQYTTYASARGAPYDGYSPRHHPTPQRERAPDYVSGGFDYVRPSRHRRDTAAPPLKRFNRERKHRPSQSQSRYVHTSVYYDDDYVYESPPPPYEQFARYEAFADANGYYYRQVPIYSDPKKASSTRRRASHSGGSKPMPDKRPSTARPTPKATEEDARKANIPAGYSYKNWDPTEEPIVLLGSVFDANSLGKWIYDWAVHHSEPASPISEMAGELWLLLIQLAGKVKRAEETMKKIRKQESRELVEDFLESGDRLWDRFCKMLKSCEEYMWKLAQKETGQKKPASLGKNSGLDFIDSLFGRDQQLEKLEKWMTGARLWGMRFDANCEDILRYPSA